MKLVLCPYGHKNDPGARFCETCRTPIPPDPTEVDEEEDEDPRPVPVVRDDDAEDDEHEPDVPESDVEPETKHVEQQTVRPDGVICPNGHWNPPDQERWCQVCAAALYEEPEEYLPEPVPLWRKYLVPALILIGVVIALIVIFVVLRDDGPDGTTITADPVTTATPTTPEPVEVDLPASAITVSASSEQPQGENFAANVLDGMRDTAWGHCGFECNGGDGTGEFIRFQFDQVYDVVEFRILNGYDKIAVNGADRWEQNNRVQTMTVTADGGQSDTVTLDDERDFQTFRLQLDQPTQTIQFTIESVYPGNEFNDVTISEVVFTVLQEPEDSS